MRKMKKEYKIFCGWFLIVFSGLLLAAQPSASIPGNETLSLFSKNPQTSIAEIPYWQFWVFFLVILSGIILLPLTTILWEQYVNSKFKIKQGKSGLFLKIKYGDDFEQSRVHYGYLLSFNYKSIKFLSKHIHSRGESLYFSLLPKQKSIIIAGILECQVKSCRVQKKGRGDGVWYLIHAKINDTLFGGEIVSEFLEITAGSSRSMSA